MNIWLCEEMKMGKLYKLFKKAGVDDMETVKSLSYELLSDIGINKVGDKIKILNAIKKLKQKQLRRRFQSSAFVAICVCILEMMLQIIFPVI